MTLLFVRRENSPFWSCWILSLFASLSRKPATSVMNLGMFSLRMVEDMVNVWTWKMENEDEEETWVGYEISVNRRPAGFSWRQVFGNT